MPLKNERWRHWKGNIYLVEGAARAHHTKEELVIYRREGSDPADLPEARPLSEFLDEARPGVPRFTRLQNRAEVEGQTYTRSTPGGS